MTDGRMPMEAGRRGDGRRGQRPRERRAARWLAGLAALLAAAGALAAPSRPLGFEERVDCQEAIERFYQAHRRGATRTFEQAVPRDLLERKVRTHLERMAALQAGGTAPDLEAQVGREWERIRRQTLAPARLRQLEAALGDDPARIRQCLVQPLVVARLARAPAGPWRGTGGAGPEGAASPEGSPTCQPDDTWLALSTSGAPSPRLWHTAVWTGAEMLVWGGDGGPDTGGRYDPVTDTWTPISTVGATPRMFHSAVWTGSEMIVWGGDSTSSSSSKLNTGGRYDPVADTWTPTSTAGAPTPRHLHSAVWTGSEMIVWGGEDSIFGKVNTGGRYDPATDTWTPTSTVNAPEERELHPAVWTGTEMIVWGGGAGNFGWDTGGRYDPATDTWTPTSQAGAPTGRVRHTAVWTGEEMVVWGGVPPTGNTDTGARYDPVADTWTPTSPSGVPRSRHTAVWTGHEMIVWGGFAGTSRSNSGQRYDPATDAWSTMTGTGAPEAREGHSAVWADNPMIVWGGFGSARLATGGGYSFGDFADHDADGVTVCAGDCDDGDPATLPGAVEVCDGRDNDCDGALPPDEVDGDADGAPQCADCDDLDPARFPGNPEICDNEDNDCDEIVDGFATTCGAGQCAAAGTCTGGVDSCTPGTPSAEACDGLDNDCDGLVPADELDGDGDGLASCEGDCDDADATIFPGAVEINDARDNQCPGDPGDGLVDEISGSVEFVSNQQICWPAQSGAQEYEVSRSQSRDLGSGCDRTRLAGTCLIDAEEPAAGIVFHYVVQATKPNSGSLGAGSAGERAAVCGAENDCDNGLDDDGDGLADCADASCFAKAGCETATFAFTDTGGDDVADASLEGFFASFQPVPGDHLHVRLSEATQPDVEYCLERADFYHDAYLDLAAGGGVLPSGAWNRWYRPEGGSWTGPVVTAHDNWFGDACAGAFSWCPEVSLGGHVPGVAPAEPGICEAFDGLVCASVSWDVAITVGIDRLSACGF